MKRLNGEQNFMLLIDDYTRMIVLEEEFRGI
jgi:hypothetical protein